MQECGVVVEMWRAGCTPDIGVTHQVYSTGTDLEKKWTWGRQQCKISDRTAGRQFICSYFIWGRTGGARRVRPPINPPLLIAWFLELLFHLTHFVHFWEKQIQVQLKAMKYVPFKYNIYFSSSSKESQNFQQEYVFFFFLWQSEISPQLAGADPENIEPGGATV